jgi:hypothetical protein
MLSNFKNPYNVSIMRLCPQFYNTDRRQNNIPVDNDRRSEQDNRGIFTCQNTKLKSDYLAVLKLIPMSRKFISAIQSFSDGQWLYSACMAFRFINEYHEDKLDIKQALKGGVDPLVEHQHPFWAVQGTMIADTKLGRALIPYDKVLYDYECVKDFLYKIGMKNPDYHDNFIKINGSYISQVLGRASLRVPILGVALFAIMESPPVIKGKNKLKELKKALVTMLCILTGSASEVQYSNLMAKLLRWL